ADALRLLKVPVGVGYEQVVASLGRRPGSRRDVERDTEPRQFLFADGAGGVERIRVDFSGPHLDHLRAALDTTPGSGPEDRQSTRAETPKDSAETADAKPSPPPEPLVDELDEELERAAEMEVGLTEDAVLQDTVAAESGVNGAPDEASGMNDRST